MTTDARAPGFLYVTRLPPSPSGVALYASHFTEVLASLAPVRIVPLPPQPRQSQGLGETLRLTHRLRRAVREHPESVVFAELAGRGLAEFWATLRLLSGGRHARVWLTIHDAPQLSGGAFFFGALDRKGLRRIAALLSRTLGRRAERRLLTRAERVYCLAPRGADELRARFGADLDVRPIGHVVAAPRAAVGVRHVIFLPGYLDGIDNIVPVLEALETAPADWGVAIGACSARTALDVSHASALRGLTGRVRLLGFQSEDELLDTYGGAGVVVRWRQGGWQHGGGARGAVSGPLMHALAAGCAIITNDTRGAIGCLAAAGALQIGDGAAGARELRDALARVMTDHGLRERLGASARQHVEDHHTPCAVAAQLEAS